MAQRLVIVGGGLAGTLIARAFAARRPDVALTLLEAGDRLGGNHTWSAFATDFTPDAAALVAPFVTHRWPGYRCRFESGTMDFTTPYLSIASETLDRVARAELGPSVRLGQQVARVAPDGVTLADGTHHQADAVIDARGPRRLDGTTLRWQKFLGREVELAAPHGLDRPIIMDATVSQIDGYRFVYVLPFGPNRLLIEDTYYAETPEVAGDMLAARIDDYAAAEGWTIARDVRTEVGALPLLLAADIGPLWRGASADGVVPAGLRAGLFHPVTGYSLPLAAAAAVTLATLPGPVTTPRLMDAMAAMVRAHIARTRFDRTLNRLLFLAGAPEKRHGVLDRFHRLPQPLIERFYAGRLRRRDRLRILTGKPPVPITAALRALSERAAFD
ncbi:lycopene beta-cyclase CrtY [Acuticoccus kandeliae]|uniref:lycopene beta-cyclase CrtY n=1 Tax=Acuticoccus kandeliae TaxID=2073160 RepID=UPI000D3E8301|nr:lycopene beta-cyclase CrtY [Acuticoccus kandeliae]